MLSAEGCALHWDIQGQEGSVTYLAYGLGPLGNLRASLQSNRCMQKSSIFFRNIRSTNMPIRGISYISYFSTVTVTLYFGKNTLNTTLSEI